MKKTMFFVKLACFLTMSMSFCSCSESGPIYDERGHIQTQISSEKCIKQDYNNVINKLKKAGFKNFRINFLGDVILGIFVKENYVDAIKINGHTKFYDDSYYDLKSVVFLDVHSSEKSVKVISEPIDGQLPIVYQSNMFNGVDKLTTGEYLRDIGFTNVTYDPIQDCEDNKSGNFNKAGNFTVLGKEDFYDYSFFDINAEIKIQYHTTPGDYCIDGLEHSLTGLPDIQPTCTEPGLSKRGLCRICNKEIAEEQMPALGHDVVIDKKGYEATCVSEGLSDETHCARCGEVLSTQKVLPIDSSNHVHLQVFEGYEATCVSEGLTNKIVCNDCGEVVADHKAIGKDPNNHQNIVDVPAVRPSKGNNGHSAGTRCSDCNSYVKAPTTILWEGSNEEAAATSELESFFPKETAKKAVMTAINNYLALDVFDSTGNYVLESKLHPYSHAARRYKIRKNGTWSWAGTNQWKFSGFVLYGGDYNSEYPLYGYISVDSTRYHLTSVSNGKSDNPSRYIIYDDCIAFNFKKSLVDK